MSGFRFQGLLGEGVSEGQIGLNYGDPMGMVAGSALCTFYSSVHTISAPSFFVHLFIQHRHQHASCATFGPGTGETGAKGSCLQKPVARAGGRQHIPARNVPHTSGSVLLEILTEPWLRDDIAGPAVDKLPAWRGCRV